MNRNLSNCEKARKKGFRGFNGICVSAAVLYQPELWRPIHWRPANNWVHQPVKGMKHRMKWCELREYKWNEYVTIAVNRNLSNCEKARKKGFRGFTHSHMCNLLLRLQLLNSRRYIPSSILLFIAMPYFFVCAFFCYQKLVQFAIHWGLMCSWLIVNFSLHFELLSV